MCWLTAINIYSYTGKSADQGWFGRSRLGGSLSGYESAELGSHCGLGSELSSPCVCSEAQMEGAADSLGHAFLMMGHNVSKPKPNLTSTFNIMPAC